MKVYCIENVLNNKKYVGVTTKGIQNRFKVHISTSKSGNKYKKQHLHNAMVVHGVDNFIIYEIDSAENVDDLFRKEKEWINKLDTKNNGYNETDGGEGVTGYTYSEEQKQHSRKMAIKRFEDPNERLKASIKSKEWFANLSDDERIEFSKKLSIAKLGNQNSKGMTYSHTEESKEKIRQARLGIPMSEEAKKKSSDKAKLRLGRKCSPETIEKMRQSARNRPKRKI